MTDEPSSDATAWPRTEFSNIRWPGEWELSCAAPMSRLYWIAIYPPLVGAAAQIGYEFK
ncbi:hypothetical protein OCO_46810 [Mycobacterium intracellulare MOTT-02]|uniref:Uncharacterized protein n=1 Tax=Mycobacterium intracellulare 1956 TaxID=1299331 RepID=X8CDZ1_MYCIT|nr:hypothetical protein OCO_46810 [Mycobacterium intracellulare MOTT-02]EUA28876.1 hypothetical protein I548_2061 [Mycobacterium intracellulare]EUA53500.1 hypothetical protein I550_5136 [Mycobacterium intracellulare 1956]